MLACEEAYALAELARRIDPDAMLAVGPVPFQGEDKHFPPSLEKDDPRRRTTSTRRRHPTPVASAVCWRP
jgi:hypothetical protein